MVGMLWFDNSPLPLAEKLNLALEYHARKYLDKPTPTIAFINPVAAIGLEFNAEGNAIVSGIKVKTTNSIAINHIWIGSE